MKDTPLEQVQAAHPGKIHEVHGPGNRQCWCGYGEMVNHPDHYGGANDPYEVIKVIEAWNLGFHLGNTVKYVARAGRKGSELEDLEKASWYLRRHIEWLRNGQ